MADILIVDDDDSLCHLLGSLLKMIGHKPRCAFDGKAGLQEVGSARPDMIVLDLMMPEMDGWQVLSRLQQDDQTREIPVVIYSAVADTDSRQHAIESGARDYWVKASFDYGQLKSKVDQVLSNRVQA